MEVLDQIFSKTELYFPHKTKNKLLNVIKIKTVRLVVLLSCAAFICIFFPGEMFVQFPRST